MTRTTLELTLPELTDRLQATPALADVTPTALEGLAETGWMRWFRKGHEIQSEGVPASSFYVLLNGRVKMSRALPTGRDVVLALFGPGEIFGTVAALGAESCNASLVALERSLCLELGRAELFALFERRPRLVGELLPILTRKLVECKNCIVELTCYRVEMRFARLLLKLADSVGEPRTDGIFIPISLSRQELADMTGTTIETCIRIMSRWGKDAVVETRKDGFLVHDRDALGLLANT